MKLHIEIPEVCHGCHKSYPPRCTFVMDTDRKLLIRCSHCGWYQYCPPIKPGYDNPLESFDGLTGKVVQGVRTSTPMRIEAVCINDRYAFVKDPSKTDQDDADMIRLDVKKHEYFLTDLDPEEMA
jgi:hypothetical protein